MTHETDDPLLPEEDEVAASRDREIPSLAERFFDEAGPRERGAVPVPGPGTIPPPPPERAGDDIMGTGIIPPAGGRA